MRHEVALVAERTEETVGMGGGKGVAVRAGVILRVASNALGLERICSQSQFKLVSHGGSKSKPHASAIAMRFCSSVIYSPGLDGFPA